MPATGEEPPRSVIAAARALRGQARPDLAATLLAREADLSDPEADRLYLSLLVDLDDRRALQTALQRSIERLPDRARLPTPYLKLLCRQAQKACAAPWIERLAQRSWKSSKTDPGLTIVLQAMSRRLMLRSRMRERAVPQASLISLGLNCLPLNVPSQWGLRRPDDYWALRSPFDSGAHRLPLVMEALESDFAAYCPPETLIQVETEGGHMAPMRKDVRAVWNHHIGAYWIADDFRRLREEMADKVQAFREGCRRDDVAFVVGRVPIDYPARPLGFLERLNRGLERFTGAARNRLIFVNEYAAAASTQWVDDWTLVLSRPFPSESYVWYAEETMDSPDGLAYEHDLAMGMLAGLSRWGLTGGPEVAAPPLAAMA